MYCGAMSRMQRNHLLETGGMDKKPFHYVPTREYSWYTAGAQLTRGVIPSEKVSIKALLHTIRQNYCDEEQISGCRESGVGPGCNY